MIGKIMDSTKLDDIVIRFENCSALISELCSTAGSYAKVFSGVRDLLDHITGDLQADIDCADECNEVGRLLVPSVQKVMEAGYTFDQAKFAFDFLNEAGNPEKTGSLFAVVVPFIVDAYECGRAGRKLEDLYPFIKRT